MALDPLALCFLVYEIRNLINDSLYIGITGCLAKKRWWQHTWEARKGHEAPLYRAIRKYGVENFRITILSQGLTLDHAKAEEIRLIALLRPRYNQSTGGESRAGCKMSPENIRKMSERMKGMPGTFTGKAHTDEARRKMSKAKLADPNRHLPRKKSPGRGLKGAATRAARGHIGRPPWTGSSRSDETKQRISEAKTGVPRSPIPEATLDIFRENMRRAARSRRKPVICLNDGRKFASAQEASFHYGLARTEAAGVAGGHRKSVKGLVFAYCEVGDGKHE